MAESRDAGRQTRSLGLVGGMSWHSTALYYERINRALEARLGRHHSFRGQISNLDFSELVAAAAAGRWADVERLIVDAMRALSAAGCGVVALTAVTAHRAYDAVRDATTVPVPHVLGGVAKELRLKGIDRAGILGTKPACGSSFVRERLAGDGRDLLFLETMEQDRLDRTIENILTTGGDRRVAREVLVASIRSLQRRDAQAVVLACTELPLLLPLTDIGIPLLDSVALHVEEICNLILGRNHAE